MVNVVKTTASTALSTPGAQFSFAPGPTEHQLAQQCQRRHRSVEPLIWCLLHLVVFAQNAEFEEFNMLSATLTFAQTHHCDITETILCCWEVANPSKAKVGELGHGGM